MSHIVRFLRGKTLFITGATGFLAKAVLEKMLWHAPDVGRVYALIRPKRLRDGSMLTAEMRLQKEIFGSALFSRLRARYGDKALDTLGEKVIAVAGDLTLDRLGIDPEVYRRLTREVDVCINTAASVTFDEEIDYALQLNTLGARRVVDFAKACPNAVLIHVSTAYVSGQRTGQIPETPPTPDRSVAQMIGLNQNPFNLEQEIKDIQTASKRIHDASRSPEQQAAFRKAALRQNPKPTQRWLDAQMETLRKRWLQQRLIQEGIRRGKMWGWHDSYTLTKAMGEQMIVKTRGDMPVAIIRPSIVESSLRDPEPGWIEGLKVADPLIDAISRGRLPDFPADPDVILDVVPVDIVVNVTLAAMPQTAQKGGLTVYQVTTGDENPIRFHELYDLVHDYFVKNPRFNKHGQPFSIQRWQYPTLKQFRRRQRLKYQIPLAVAQWVIDRLSGILPVHRWRQRVNVLKSAIERMLYYAEIYSPYTTLDCRFETVNTRNLHKNLAGEERVWFDCDVHRIDWPTYIQDIHIPGLKRHVLKTEPAEREDQPVERAEAEAAEPSDFEQPDGNEPRSDDGYSYLLERNKDRDANGY